MGLLLVHEPKTLCFTGQYVAKTWHHVIASLLRSLSQLVENAQLLVVPDYQSFFRFMNLVYHWTTTWEQTLLWVSTPWDTVAAENLSEKPTFSAGVSQFSLNLIYNHLNCCYACKLVGMYNNSTKFYCNGMGTFKGRTLPYPRVHLRHFFIFFFRLFEILSSLSSFFLVNAVRSVALISIYPCFSTILPKRMYKWMDGTWTMTIFLECMKEESSIPGQSERKGTKKASSGQIWSWLLRYQAWISWFTTFLHYRWDQSPCRKKKRTSSSDQSSGGRGGFVKVVFLASFLGLELLTNGNVETILWSSLFVWDDSSMLDLHMPTALDKSMQHLDFLSEESSSQRPKRERNRTKCAKPNWKQTNTPRQADLTK